jgi:hypothetical protein
MQHMVFTILKIYKNCVKLLIYIYIYIYIYIHTHTYTYTHTHTYVHCHQKCKTLFVCKVSDYISNFT